MDEDLERALKASILDQADQLDEDSQLQEAIRLSKLENEEDISTASDNESDEDAQLQKAIRLSKTDSASASTTTFEDQLKNRSVKMKRKADDELRMEGVKRSASVSLRILSSKRVSSSLAKASIKYSDGALRITRTPGRHGAKNCVNLEDLIQKDDLVSACVYAFYIAEPELFIHLPLSHDSDSVPIYIGRDPRQDAMVLEACQNAGIPVKEKQFQDISSTIQQLCMAQYGQNYHSFYAWSPGSSHSKILVLVYPEFMRLVITSCNMMDIDTVLGDNHYYIHDLPKLPSRVASEGTPFEEEFLTHLRALNTPNAFIDSIRGFYDYSKVKVHLVTSAPGVSAGVKAEKHGLLRLRRIIQTLNLKSSKSERRDLKLEVCTASIGHLNAKWLNGFYDCALGKGTLKVAEDGCTIPDLKLFYPTMGDVKSAEESAQHGASNIGCHIRPWNDAPEAIKNLFHHYESKDKGRLFHQKLIMAYNPSQPKTLPYYIYVGSSNLSISAWGGVEHDKRGNDATCNTKLVGTKNFECGIVIPGHLIEGLLEEGSESWQSIVPYVQSAPKFDLSKDKPWGDVRWVQNFQDNF